MVESFTENKSPVTSTYKGTYVGTYLPTVPTYSLKQVYLNASSDLWKLVHNSGVLHGEEVPRLGEVLGLQNLAAGLRIRSSCDRIQQIEISNTVSGSHSG